MSPLQGYLGQMHSVILVGASVDRSRSGAAAPENPISERLTETDLVEAVREMAETAETSFRSARL